MANTKRTPIGADTDKAKRKRLPIFDKRMRMSFPRDPTKYRLWVNDERGMLQDYLDSGFDYVDRKAIGWVGEGDIESGSQMESRVCLNVGRTSAGDNTMAYLMEIDMAEWEEIRAMIHEERNQPLKDIHRTKSQMKNDGFYGDINIK